jgi:hypothetical protein
MFDLVKFIRDEYVIKSDSDALEAVFAVRDQWNKMSIPYDLRDFLKIEDSQWYAIYEALKPRENDVTYPTFNADTVTYDHLEPYLLEGYKAVINKGEVVEYLYCEDGNFVYVYEFVNGNSYSKEWDSVDRAIDWLLQLNGGTMIQVVHRENE